MLQECMNLEPNKKKDHPYSDGLRLGDYLWISGQLPLDCKTEKIAGKTMQQQTCQAMKNICTVLKSYDLTVDHLMRVTIYMTDMAQYDEMNEAYAAFFGENFPTRSVVGVTALPYGALIEIEGYALDTRALEVLCREDCCDDEEGSGFCCIGDKK
jgi:2-iminobutanoate/2-iminopropanoate deaminase